MILIFRQNIKVFNHAVCQRNNAYGILLNQHEHFASSIDFLLQICLLMLRSMHSNKIGTTERTMRILP